MDRKTKADERYRQKFYALGLDKDWDYIKFERKDHIWFRCKKCGYTAPRGNDIFKGRQSRLMCKQCGNGSVLSTPFAEKVFDYYSSQHSVEETCEKFNIDKDKLNDWIKRRGISNGRDFKTAANDKRVEEAKPKIYARLALKGYVLFGEWHGESHKYKVLNLRTGEIFTRSGRCLAGRNTENGRKSRIKNVCDNSDITLIKLIQRDGSRCYLCGKETDFNDKRWISWGPDYPSIDHVIPLAKGGRHCWSNVRVCCGWCNVKKGAKYGKETRKA